MTVSDFMHKFMELADDPESGMDYSKPLAFRDLRTGNVAREASIIVHPTGSVTVLLGRSDVQ